MNDLETNSAPIGPKRSHPSRRHLRRRERRPRCRGLIRCHPNCSRQCWIHRRCRSRPHGRRSFRRFPRAILRSDGLPPGWTPPSRLRKVVESRRALLAADDLALRLEFRTACPPCAAGQSTAGLFAIRAIANWAVAGTRPFPWAGAPDAEIGVHAHASDRQCIRAMDSAADDGDAFWSGRAANSAIRRTRGCACSCCGQSTVVAARLPRR
jgi:hypothetical protein